MKAITITRYGGPDVLAVQEFPDPHPGPGELRISVQAAGLNFAEIMARKGLYPDAPKAPCVVGYEASGTVDAVGKDLSEDYWLGKRVVCLTQFGGHADMLCVPAEQVLEIPESMDFTVAAAIPVVYLTAYHMLFHSAQLRPGDNVLIHMAAGGVGIAALQLCQTVADVTTFGTASPGKHDVIQSYGCTYPIDYRSLDYSTEIRKIIGKDGGLNIVLDALGGKDWRKGYDLLGPTGHLVAFGFANVSSGEKRKLGHLIKEFLQIPRYTPMRLMDDNRSISGVNMGHLWSHISLLRKELEALLPLYETGKIAPRVDQVFPFSQAADAHRYMEERRNIGKVILVPDP